MWASAAATPLAGKTRKA
jgi:hypothetical protein